MCTLRFSVCWIYKEAFHSSVCYICIIFENFVLIKPQHSCTVPKCQRFQNTSHCKLKGDTEHKRNLSPSTDSYCWKIFSFQIFNHHISWSVQIILILWNYESKSLIHTHICSDDYLNISDYIWSLIFFHLILIWR